MTRVEETLKELGPAELAIISKVLKNIKAYIQMYEYLINYLVSEYRDIDIDKISHTSDEIDDSLSHLGRGERLFIYNKLNEPFVIDLFKKLKREKEIANIWLKELNISILALHPGINIKKMERCIKEVDEKVKSFKYEEKWLIFTMLGYILVQDLAESLK